MYANFLFFYFVHFGLFLYLRLACVTFVIKTTNEMKSWEQALHWALSVHAIPNKHELKRNL